MVIFDPNRFLPREKAKRILSQLEVGAPDEIDIDWIAYKRGVLVRSSRIDGAEARLTRAGKEGIITVSSNIEDRGRIRFNIAHELGHFELHQKEETLSICTSNDLNQWYQSQSELELSANIFAAELLMPEIFFEPLVKNKIPSFKEIKKLAGIFNSSIMATATRFVGFSEEPCCLFFLKNGRIASFGPSKDFPYMVRGPKEEVDQNSEAHKFFTKGTTDISRPTQIDADAWLSDKKVSANKIIWEDTFPMPRYNTALTLVWIKDHIEKDDYSNEGLLNDLDPDDDLSPGGRKRGNY